MLSLCKVRSQICRQNIFLRNIIYYLPNYAESYFRHQISRRIILKFYLITECIDIRKSRYNDIRLRRLNSIKEFVDFVKIIESSNILHILYAVVSGLPCSGLEIFCSQDRLSSWKINLFMIDFRVIWNTAHCNGTRPWLQLRGTGENPSSIDYRAVLVGPRSCRICQAYSLPRNIRRNSVSSDW
jgi:hypothetical protein